MKLHRLLNFGKHKMKVVLDPSVPVGQVRLRAVSSSASIDDVADAFYDDYATSESGRYWWWIQMILLEPNELIVNNGENDLFRMPFTITDNGPGNEPTIEFQDPTPIRLEPVDTTSSDGDEAVAASVRQEAAEAICAGIASARGTSRVAASYRSRGESRPSAKEGEKVREYIERLRAKLGLGTDVPDEQVLAAAATRMEAEPEGEPEAVTPPEEQPQEEQTQPEEEPETVTPPQQGTAAGARSSVVVDASALEDLRRQAELGAQAHARQLEADCAELVDGAIRKGKIPKNARANLVAEAKRDFKGTKEYLDGLAENVIPIALRAEAEENGGDGNVVAAGAHDQWLAQHMPDVAARKARVAAGNGYPRIMSDGSRLPGGQTIVEQ